jgi:hypothetical protein
MAKFHKFLLQFLALNFPRRGFKIVPSISPFMIVQSHPYRSIFFRKFKIRKNVMDDPERFKGETLGTFMNTRPRKLFYRNCKD